MNPPITREAAGIYTIAVGPWPSMLARLLLETAEGNADSRLSMDLALARRLATLLGEDASTKAALSRLLIEGPAGEQTLPYVEVELGLWSRMRAVMLVRAVEVAGSVGAASIMLDIPRGQLRRQLRSARFSLRRS